jgi:hypothetical protein
MMVTSGENNNNKPPDWYRPVRAGFVSDKRVGRVMRKRPTDRRNYGAANRFPLKDYSDCIIPFNRSNRPDRRLRSYRLSIIETEELQLADIIPLYESA